MDEHPLLDLTSRLTEATDLTRTDAMRFLREAWNAGVAEGLSRAADARRPRREGDAGETG